MGNQVGLIISLFFLSIFIALSSEIISYQKVNALAISNTNVIAIHVQKYGYDEDEINYLNQDQFFDEIIIEAYEEKQLIKYEIQTIKRIDNHIKIFSFTNKDIICSVFVIRKNNYEY